jgi:hypothetical protein
MIFSEIKRIDIRHKCAPHGVLLRWISPSNNFESWLFAGKTTKVTDVNESVLFAGADERQTETLYKQGETNITLRTMNFTAKQAEGIATLFTSPKVYAYFPDSDEAIPVQINEGTFVSVDQLVKHQTLTFEIILPKTNSLMQ